MLPTSHRGRRAGLKRLSARVRPFLLVAALLHPGCDSANSPPASSSSASSADADSTGSATASRPFASPTPSGTPSPASGLPASPVAPATPSQTQSQPRTQFTEVARSLGIDHTYQNGEAGRLLMVEAIGGGAAWLDYDGDQRWDLYLGQGGDPVKSGEADQPTDRLWRQTPRGEFEEVTAPAGIVETRYGQGVSVADFDGDGFDDVYVTNVGRNTLWKNQGDGTFVDATLAAGVADERWSSSSAWGDLDGDGDLDLYVANYCDFDVHHPRSCLKDGQPHICHPLDVPPVPDTCYWNQGDGTFRPATADQGLLPEESGRALGVVIADFDNDGDADIYVANDMTANFLFVNEGAGHFRESGILLGCAVDRNGSPQASMGVACGDYDGNGFLDVYCTHFHLDYNTLYQNLGATGMRDITALVGLVTPTLPFLGFGTVMADFDRDGQQELFVGNGHIERTPVRGNLVFDMEAQLFAYDGRRFQDISPSAGEYFREKRLSRAVSSADFDQDGDLDLLVVNQNAPVALLRNDSPPAHGISFRFRGAGVNRRGLGTRVTVEAGGKRWMQELFGGSSYATSHQPQLVFGLGQVTEPVRATVRWPDGQLQTYEQLPVDQLHVLAPPPPAE